MTEVTLSANHQITYIIQSLTKSDSVHRCHVVITRWRVWARGTSIVLNAAVALTTGKTLLYLLKTEMSGVLDIFYAS